MRVKHKFKIVVGLALVIAIGTSIGLWFWPANDAQAELNARSKKAQTTFRARVVNPEEGGIERKVVRPGTVHAFQYAQLYTKVSGFLQKQRVDIGARVKVDELLAELFAPELQADVRKSESDLTKAKAHVEVMKAQVASAEADLDQAKAKLGQEEADVQSKEAMVTLRKQEHKRIKSLAQQGAVDRELQDEKAEAQKAAEATLRASEKSVVTAKAGIVAAEAHVRRAGAELADSEAQVQVADAVLSRARSFEGYTRITSPYDGVVTQRGFHDGDFIRDAGSGNPRTPVFTVARTDLMRVVVWVPDRDVPLTEPGATAEVAVDALAGRRFNGTVARIAAAEDFSSRTMRAEIDLKNTDGKLRDGMYGQVTIFLGKTKSGVTIPAAALGNSGKDNERTVYVVRDGKAHRVSVKVGLNDGVRAEVSEGLDRHDLVVISHDAGLTDGSPVEAVRGGRPEGVAQAN